MTFEEKLAAYGRKMDEKKAKLDEAISARKQERQETREEIVAEIAELEAQIEKQYDTLDAQIEKQCDTMDAQLQKQVNTLGTQIDKQFETMDAALDRAEEKAEQDIAKVKAAFTLDKGAAEAIANEATKIDRIQAGTAEQVARAKGDIATAEENVRLTREERARKRDALQLRAQMKVNNAKEKVAERKEARDKAAQEAWILDLLDYADNCYGMAHTWALEAEYTLMEAAYELDYYNERFCKEE